MLSCCSRRDAPLGLEPAAQQIGGELGPDELHRHDLFEGAVVAVRSPDRAHAAAPDLDLEKPRADPARRCCRRQSGGARALEC
jgi:hypothetical protein